MNMAQTVPELAQLAARLERVERHIAGQKGSRPESKPSTPLPWRRWMPKFVGVLRRSGNVSEAIRSSPRSRKMVYEYRERCEAFALAWDEALEEHRQRVPTTDADGEPT